MTVRIVHKNSTAEDKRPTPGQLANGEIAVNLSDAGAFLSVKDSAGNIQQVGGVKVSSSPPANPVKGTLWVDADVDSLYIFDGNTWRGLTGGTGSGGDDVIAGNGLDETQSGNVVTLFVVGGEAIRVDSNGVHVDLEADASRTGGNGLEINSDKLRAKLATPTNLGVVQVDDSTIKVTPDGQISAVTNTPLNYKGNLDIVNGGNTDPQPTNPLLGDTYTSAETGTIFTPWTNLLDNPPTNTTAGDLIICQADGGGNGNWVLVPAAGNNPWIDSNTGYVYLADPANEVRVQALANGNESLTGTDLAMIDDLGQLVRAAPGTGLGITGGQLTNTLPTYWNNPASTDDLKPNNTAHKIMADTLANGTEGTTGTSVGMLDDDGRFVRADPGAGLTINGSGQLEALAQAQYWDRAGTTLSPATDGDTVTVTDGTGTAVITFNPDGTADFTGNVEIGTGIDLNTDGTATFTGNVSFGPSNEVLINADGTATFTGNVEIGTGIDLNTDGTADFAADVTLSGTGAIKAPAGTTAQRPGTPAAGMFRFNSDAGKFEGYDGTTWSDVGSVSAWQRVGTTLSPNNDGDTVTVTDGSGNVVITFNPDGTADFTSDVTLSGAGYLKLPVGYDSERPTTPARGMVRYTVEELDPATGFVTYKGELDITAATAEPTSPLAGDAYVSSVTGTIDATWTSLLTGSATTTTAGEYIICQVDGGGAGNWAIVQPSEPANIVELYNGSTWTQVLDETVVGTQPNQISSNGQLGQLAFTDNVNTIRPFVVDKTISTAADLPQPVFNGEATVTFNDTDDKLWIAYRKLDGTVIKFDLGVGTA